jgi:hypothetical protein
LAQGEALFFKRALWRDGKSARGHPQNLQNLQIMARGIP